MSTNAKNIVRPEFLKNFTKNIENRVVLVQGDNNYGDDINNIIADSNSSINSIVQSINIKCESRQIPYITLKAKVGNALDKDVRILLRNYYTQRVYEEKIKFDFVESNDISHLIDFLIVEGFKEITISSLMLDVELIIDKDYIVSAITDIILDILMFNSYSFLQKMDLQQRREFSKNKFEYFRQEKLPCFYDCNSKDLVYYSLAFSARTGKDEFSVEKYILVWDEFIKAYYPKYRHREKTVKAQIEQHVDKGELPNNYYKRFYNKPQGAYLIIRTNKERTPKIHRYINSVFGLSKYEYGKIKIVPLEKFEEYKPMFENLDVSAFKVVNTKYRPPKNRKFNE